MLSSKKAPIVFPTVVYTTAILLLISTFYLSLLSLQTVIYVPFFVFQKIAFTSSIVDPDQNARISVTSIMKFQERREIRQINQINQSSWPTYAMRPLKKKGQQALHLYSIVQGIPAFHDFTIRDPHYFVILFQ